MTEDIDSLGLKTDAECEEFIKYEFPKDHPHNFVGD